MSKYAPPASNSFGFGMANLKGRSGMTNKLLERVGLGDGQIAAWQWKVLLVLTFINLLN
jgi:hypothetical protein